MKRIAVFNDLSGFGKCSLSVSLPIISACGIQCCPLPTAVFTKQTAFENYHYKDLTDEIPQYINDWTEEHFDGIYTGFFTDEKQMQLAEEFILRHPESGVVLVDPVLGDNGDAYPVCTDELLCGMKKLINVATVITPNLTELAMLSATDYQDLVKSGADKIYKTALGLLGTRLETVIVTGIHINNKVCNLIASKKGYILVSSHLYHGSFSGTGDIFASIVAAMLTNGKTAKYSVSKAAKFISKAAKSTINTGIDPRHGIEFEKYLNLLH